MPEPARGDFEAHLLTCDVCWREISLARQGRELAERAHPRARLDGAGSHSPASCSWRSRPTFKLCARHPGGDRFRYRLRSVRRPAELQRHFRSRAREVRASSSAGPLAEMHRSHLGNGYRCVNKRADASTSPAAALGCQHGVNTRDSEIARALNDLVSPQVAHANLRTMPK